VDRDHLENSKVEAVIEVASITTNTKMRDDDLRSIISLPRPISIHDLQERVMESTGDNTYAATGVLTMKKHLEGSRAQGHVAGLRSGHDKVHAISGWEATLTLDRRDF